MSALLANERIRALLREADDARRLLERVREAGGDETEIRDAIDSIYRDLGRHLHETWRSLLDSSPQILEPAPAPPSAGHENASCEPAPDAGQLDLTESEPTDLPEVTNPQVSDEVEGWYTDEVDVDGPQQPLFSPEELAMTSPGGRVVASEPPTIEPTAAEPLVLSLASAAASVLPSTIERGAAWSARLIELLGLLGNVVDDDGHLATEASRLQWATTNLASWSEFPHDVQAILAAMLSVRARRLQDRPDVGLGMRLALDRLRRHTQTNDLPLCAGLLPDGQPEAGSWFEDARCWRQLLDDGLA